MSHSKFLVIAIFLFIISCSPALPAGESNQQLESKVRGDILLSAKKSEAASREAELKLEEAKRLHADVKRMLEESRSIKAECSSAAKRTIANRQAARKAAQKKAAEKKPESNSQYSPSDAPAKN